MTAADPDLIGTIVRRHWATRIRTARDRQGLTITDLANRVGVHPDAIRKWEQATRMPSLGSMWLLARALDVAPGELFAWPDWEEITS